MKLTFLANIAGKITINKANRFNLGVSYILQQILVKCLKFGNPIKYLKKLALEDNVARIYRFYVLGYSIRFGFI